jgi:hypothetical protein
VIDDRVAVGNEVRREALDILERLEYRVEPIAGALLATAPKCWPKPS